MHSTVRKTIYLDTILEIRNDSGVGSHNGQRVRRGDEPLLANDHTTISITIYTFKQEGEEIPVAQPRSGRSSG